MRLRSRGYLTNSVGVGLLPSAPANMTLLVFLDAFTQSAKRPTNDHSSTRSVDRYGAGARWREACESGGHQRQPAVAPGRRFTTTGGYTRTLEVLFQRRGRDGRSVGRSDHS